MKIDLSVSGMTCGGCELHVEKAALEVDGVIKAKASHSAGKLTVTTDESINEENHDQFFKIIEVKINEAGYSFHGKFEKKNDSFSIKQWVGLIIIIAAVFLVVRETGIMSRLPVIESSMGYGLIFIIGLMTSVHCIGMCGGINLTVSLSGLKNNDGKPTVFKRTKPALLYNAGRVISYTIIGGLAGLLGSVISITGTVQGIIVGIAGIFMLLMGINMLGLFPWIDKIIPRLPGGIASRIVNSGSGRGPFTVGLLNGFMPCGPLQSVQIYALGTGSAFSGALSMLLFSLGTTPLMLGFGSISSILPPRFHTRILKVSALLVLLLGGGMIARGMSLSGMSLAAAGNFNGNTENVRIAEIKEGKQYVTTIMHDDLYEPFIVEAGIPVVWTIIADSKVLNGCNNPLTVPEFGIRFEMVPGENIIEFTPPQKAGVITYTCWMGMITSGIKVVEDLDAVDASLLGDAAGLSESSESCGGGGEGSGSCCASVGSGESFSAGSSGYLFNPVPEIPADSIGIARITDNIQVVEVAVTEKGFEPSIIIMKKGVEAQWILNGETLNEQNYRVNFPAYGNQGIELQQGENALQILPEFGFAYYSWRNDFGGWVEVVDEIDKVDLELVRLNVNEFNANR